MLSHAELINQSEGLTALALILSDPKSFEAKREELKQYAADAKAAFEDAQKMESSAKSTHADAKSKLAEAELIREEFMNRLGSFNTHADKISADLDQREARISQMNAEAQLLLDTAQSNHQKAASERAQAEQSNRAAKDIQDNANKELTIARTMREEHEKILAKAKALLGTQ